MNYEFLANILCSEIFFRDPTDYIHGYNYKMKDIFIEKINEEMRFIIKNALKNYSIFFGTSASILDIKNSIFLN